MQNQHEKDVIKIRPFETTDFNFIHSSFVRSLNKSENMTVEPCWDLLQWLIPSRTLVMCVANDPACIVGWCCADVDVLFYVYIKAAFRKMGMATALMNEFELKSGCQHVFKGRSKECHELIKSLKSQYNPFYLMSHR